MKFSIPNIYTYKNLKVFIAVPIILMLVSVYLSQNLTLDSSLSGGVSVLLQANTSMNAQQIASKLSQSLNIPSPTVQVTSSEVQITISANRSLSNAENYLLDVYQYHSNYSSYLLNATNYQIALSKEPSNHTLAELLNSSQKGENISLAGMQHYINLESSSLSPFVKSPYINNTNADSLLSSAQSMYSEAGNTYEKTIMSGILSVVPSKFYSYQQISVLQSSYFLQQLETIIIIAFILISIIVFFIFRTAVPSFAVVFGAANDMIVAIGAMSLFRIPLGIASIGGLLMLLGYSIDTDVLTAIRIIKRHEGTPEDRAYSSMKTGLTMTFTAIVSFAVLFIVSLVLYVPTYYEISGVVLFGLIGDLATTWLGNASMILLYIKRKERVK